MATYDAPDQLSLPLAPTSEPQIADAGPPIPPSSKPADTCTVQELTNAQLLTAILGNANATLCGQLTETHGTLRRLAALNSALLYDLGFTAQAIHRLEALFELMKRHGETEWTPGAIYRSSGDIYLHFRERLATEAVEYFYAVLLDNHHRKIRDVMVSKGTLTASLVQPRDIFGQVIRYSAAAVLFVHNHPSGDPTPSREDLEITRRLREVGQLIGVRVLDHIVIGQGRYISFVENGYW